MNFFQLHKIFKPDVMPEETDPFIASLFQRLEKRIADTSDPSYAVYAVEHGHEVGSELTALLSYLGYDKTSALSIGQDAVVHDIGKTHANQAGCWKITLEKRAPSQEEREERPRHTHYTAELIHAEITAMGASPDALSPAQSARVERMIYLGERHHDRFDDPSPKNQVLNAMCAVDALAGKRKGVASSILGIDVRIPQSQWSKEDQTKASTIALHQLMTEAKHEGQLDPGMLKLYAQSLALRGKIHKPDVQCDLLPLIR